MSRSAVVVTGAAGGMGREHAKEAATLGAHVYVADVQDGAETVKQISSNGGSAEFVELDVTDLGAWRSLGDRIVGDGRTLVGLVNNAGITNRQVLRDISLDEFARVLDVNLLGAFRGMQTLAPIMAAAGGGSIVNIASVTGMVGYFAPAYAASKWGLIGMSKSAAGELAVHGIRVNCVLPGVITTPMSTGASAIIASVQRSVPLGRTGNPEDVSKVVRFLLSDQSTYVTGADWVVDGGLTSNGLYSRILAEVKD